MFYAPLGFCWCSGWSKMKMLWLYNLKLQQAMENQAYVVISKFCLWWRPGLCVFWTCFVGWGRKVSRWNGIYLFGRLFDHRKRNFFIKIALKPQILKDRDQGLLKLHVHLGRFQYEGKIGLSPKKKLCLKQKNNVWGGF